MYLSVCFSTYLPTYISKGFLGQNQEVVESSPNTPFRMKVLPSTSPFLSLERASSTIHCVCVSMS